MTHRRPNNPPQQLSLLEALTPFTPRDRADFYNRAYPKFPAVFSDKGWLIGHWNLGNNYRGSGYHGAYRPSYLRRVMAMFPDAHRVLHVFSGSLPPDGHTRLDRRIDSSAGVVPDVCADAHALPFKAGVFDLILADPPYSAENADHYGTPMIKRKRVFDECVRVLAPEGHLVWLDMIHPMYRNAALHLWGEIGITRSTSHRYRVATMWERLQDRV